MGGWVGGWMGQDMETRQEVAGHRRRVHEQTDWSLGKWRTEEGKGVARPSGRWVYGGSGPRRARTTPVPVPGA